MGRRNITKLQVACIQPSAYDSFQQFFRHLIAPWTLSTALLAGVAFLLVNIKSQYINTQTFQTKEYLAQPAIDDIYFLDFRKLSRKLRPQEKYRLAKVVDITGNIITLQYGNWFFPFQNSAVESIKLGQLRYPDYFETKRHNFKLDELADMRNSGAIYLIERPWRGQLYGNETHPANRSTTNPLTFRGGRENNLGESYLYVKYSETNLITAFTLFQRSAKLNNPYGQVNLAQMYLNGQSVAKDLTMALYWLKQAALQSHKPAIYKYAIVCQQVKTCNIVNFYQQLIESGVNIKIRSLDVKLAPSFTNHSSTIKNH